MKTAVEWFEEQVGYTSLMALKEFNEIFEQAKEMEKEKEIEFAKYCLDKAKDLDIITAFMNVEEYYETFKQEQ